MGSQSAALSLISTLLTVVGALPLLAEETTAPHWAFVAPRSPAPPDVRKVDWPCNEIDHFILAHLEKEGLGPSPEAGREVLFGGEFGRTIYGQGDLTKDTYGRDHHGRCFTTVVAGGGFKAGIDYGATDDHCFNVIEDPVHINDLNASVLHCLGIDHEHFSVKHQGLDLRLTGVEGAKVIPGLLV